MFKVTKNPQFTHTVEVMVPVDGGFRKDTFRATFEVLDSDADEGDFDLSTTSGSTAFLKAAVKRMDDIIGDDDKPLPYSDTLRDELLKLPFIRLALTRAYVTAVNKVALGN